ncbi:Histidyl-tRNA synthetase [Gemmatirosa kalamazoonensis]|uniref:Histidine--tRNA ligase n=1 Tax=Gemmatirosa kalamazoonensis TaxID=861299 RepID=W0RNA3_9BACT|nr:histidine--tRNA ligase [Gemmatirosa kalamazoonensis]AHG90928.1 Histidyl-tRNA synthetase [Gemmatirosa kalamazoonensis]
MTVSKPLPGFRDFFPAEFAERAYIVNTWRSVARRYAFVEYDGPPLEPLELYTRKSGEEIVGQLYNFEDKGGRAVAMRPEMTPTFARMVASRANALRKPVRWFSVPQLFRYERQQRGRLREHFQLNVDLVGESDVSADAELLAVAIDIMRAFGLAEGDVVARVSDRRLLAALLAGVGIDEAQLPAAYAAIDKIERDPREVLLERLANAGIANDVGERVLDLARPWTIEDLRAAHPHASEHVDRMERYLALLDALGVRKWVKLDLTIVRGLAYYTGIVFEIFDRQGEFRAICGGGRYDTLLSALGGVDLPALGFGMGDVVLGELLRSRGLMPSSEPAIHYWVAYDDPALLPMAMHTATLLRRLGYAVEYALREQSLDKQLKAARSAGAVAAVLLKRDTLASSQSVTLRRLADKAEETLTMSAWMDQLTAAHEGRPPVDGLQGPTGID